ncbi:MAG: hypothetical protein K2J89_05365 [Clostridia bacterium]|nr:hypothetical protein [Clostridia bacterium]
MRNKKLIFVATLILTISVLLCAFAGCQKEVTPAEVLMSFYQGEAKPTVHSAELTNLKDYTIQTIYGEVVHARKRNDGETVTYTHVLFNIAENKVIATSDNSFGRAFDGVFATTKYVEDETLYSFYDKNGVIRENVKQGDYTAYGKVLKFNDGTVYVSTESGVISFEQNLDNLTNLANYEMLSNVQVYETDSMIIVNTFEDSYLVYDKDRNFKYSAKLSTLVNAMEDDEVSYSYLGKNKVAIQVLRELTEVEAQSGFTFVNDGSYYALTTYIYDLESRALTNVDFNKFIYGSVMTSKDGAYALLSISDITSRHIANDRTLIVTDNDLNEKVKLNDFVDNAQYFAVIDETTFAILDNFMINIFNSNGDLVKSYPATALQTRSGLMNVGRYFYDIKGNEVYKMEKDALSWMDIESDGLIYFVKEGDDELSELCVYDSNSKATARYDFTKYDTITPTGSSEDLFFTISDEEDNITIYKFYDGKALSDKKFVRATARTSNGYTVVSATDADGNVTYFSYWIEYPEN